jgi:hypothetical protein
MIPVVWDSFTQKNNYIIQVITSVLSCEGYTFAPVIDPDSEFAISLVCSGLNSDNTELYTK